MAELRKIDRWAEELLDTGKRNNLINFKDSKASSAELVFPDCESVFSRCTMGHVFEVYDPKIPDEEFEDIPDSDPEKKLTKEEFKEKYSSIRNIFHIIF